METWFYKTFLTFSLFLVFSGSAYTKRLKQPTSVRMCVSPSLCFARGCIFTRSECHSSIIPQVIVFFVRRNLHAGLCRVYVFRVFNQFTISCPWLVWGHNHLRSLLRLHDCSKLFPTLTWMVIFTIVIHFSEATTTSMKLVPVGSSRCAVGFKLWHPCDPKVICGTFYLFQQLNKIIQIFRFFAGLFRR